MKTANNHARHRFIFRPRIIVTGLLPVLIIASAIGHRQVTATVQTPVELISTDAPLSTKIEKTSKQWPLPQPYYSVFIDRTPASRQPFPPALFRTAEELATDNGVHTGIDKAEMSPPEWMSRQSDEYRFQPLTEDWLHRPPLGTPGRKLPAVQAFGAMSFVKPLPSGRIWSVLLDPGHGGSDQGTVGPMGLLEKDLTLDISNRVKRLLRGHPNIAVKLSRNQDIGFSRERRLRSVQSNPADLLVSLHFNNLPQKELTVVEAYYAGKDNIIESEISRIFSSGPIDHSAYASRVAYRARPDLSFTDNSKRIARILQRNIFNEVAVGNPDVVNGGTKPDTLYMLTRSYMPGTLIELTCLSNPKEEKKLRSGSYRNRIAIAIAYGLIEYFTTLPQTGDKATGI